LRFVMDAFSLHRVDGIALWKQIANSRRGGIQGCASMLPTR
jgi:hypothetical protein